MMPEFDTTKNLFEYHSVFAATLAIYINIRKEIASETFGNQAKSAKRREAMAILWSNIIYAIMLKRTDEENANIPTSNYPALVEWLKAQEKAFRGADLGEDEVLDAFFALTVRKLELAGLTANSEKTMTSKMNMLISQVDREGRE